MAVTIPVRSGSRIEMLDITSAIKDQLNKSAIAEGLCMAYVPHTTAGITINEGADPAVCEDIAERLNALIPSHAGYRHMEGNADSHIKASLVGSSVQIIVENRRLILGTWQKVFFCEFDGPRSRKVYLKFLPLTSSPAPAK